MHPKTVELLSFPKSINTTYMICSKQSVLKLETLKFHPIYKWNHKNSLQAAKNKKSKKQNKTKQKKKKKKVAVETVAIEVVVEKLT